jgi:hypothetical protein
MERTKPNEGELDSSGDQIARLYGLQLTDLAWRLNELDLEVLNESFAALAIEIEKLAAIDPSPALPAVRLTFEDWQ